jgi:hypothetical protein
VKKGCNWVVNATTAPPTICGFKPGPLGYCKKHARTMKDLDARPRKCPRCGEKECDHGLKKVVLRDGGQ